MGGLAATFVVLGAELAEILNVAGGPAPAPLVKAPIPFPNAGSAVKPVPGTRPEYTPVPEFYRVDIDLTPPAVDAATWRLRISGMVAKPLALTLAAAQVRLPGARGVHHAGVHLQSDRRAADRDHAVERAVLPRRPRRRCASGRGRATHTCSRPTATTRRWTSRPSTTTRGSCSSTTGTASPLPQEHGFPLRVYVPDVYGMKQPKWITDIVLVSQWIPGYWVQRGWDAKRGPQDDLGHRHGGDRRPGDARRPHLRTGRRHRRRRRPRHLQGRGAGRRRAVGSGRAAAAALRPHLGDLALRVAVPEWRARVQGARLRRRPGSCRRRCPTRPSRPVRPASTACRRACCPRSP